MGGTALDRQRSGPEIRDHRGPARRAVADPQLTPVERVTCRAIEQRADDRELRRPRAELRVAVAELAGNAIAEHPEIVDFQRLPAIRDEGERIAERAELVREGARIAGTDVGREHGAKRAAIAAPELATVDAVVRAEPDLAGVDGELLGRRTARRRDVAQQGQCERVAVAMPELDAVDAVVGREHEAIAEGHELAHVARAAGPEIGDEDGAGRGPIAAPELAAVAVVIGDEPDQAGAHHEAAR
jgi:hypothetical protein